MEKRFSAHDLRKYLQERRGKSKIPVEMVRRELSKLIERNHNVINDMSLKTKEWGMYEKPSDGTVKCLTEKLDSLQDFVDAAWKLLKGIADDGNTRSSVPRQISYRDDIE